MLRWPVLLLLLVVLVIAGMLERDFRVDAAVLSSTTPFGGPQRRYPLMKAPQGFVFKPLDNPQPKKHRHLSCPKAAVNSYRPICAWEPATQAHRTFANECEMHRVSRITATHWISIRSGACTKSMLDKMKRSSLKARSGVKSGKAIPCPKVYNPVCAHLHGVKSTFHNECLVNAENINTGNEWEVFAKGICEEDYELRDEIKKTHTVRKRSVLDTHDSKMDIDFDSDRSSGMSFNHGGGVQSDGANVKDADSWMSDNPYPDEDWTMYDEEEPPLANGALIEEFHIGETKISFTDASEGFNLADALERDGEQAAKHNVLRDEIGYSLFNDDDFANEYVDYGDDGEYSFEQTNGAGSQTTDERSLLDRTLVEANNRTSHYHRGEEKTVLATENQIEDRRAYASLLQNLKENVETQGSYNVHSPDDVYSENEDVQHDNDEVQYGNEDFMKQFDGGNFDDQQYEEERQFQLIQESPLEKTLPTHNQTPKTEEVSNDFFKSDSIDSGHLKYTEESQTHIVEPIVQETVNFFQKSSEEPQRFDIFSDIIDLDDEEIRPIGKRQVKAESDNVKKQHYSQLPIPKNDTADKKTASKVKLNSLTGKIPNFPEMKYKPGDILVTFPKPIPWMKKYVKGNKMHNTSITHNISKNFTKVHSNCKYGQTAVCARNGDEFLTFANMCDLINHNTRLNSNWFYLHSGNCNNCNRNCTEDYQPVCATRNGVKLTFATECHLNEMICKNKSVQWAVLGKGECSSNTMKSSTEGPTRAPDSIQNTELWFQYRFANLPNKLERKNG